jgi:hypothetical protein
MANDRMYIRCTGCDEWFFVGKFFGHSWDFRGTDTALDAYLQSHVGCDPACDGWRGPKTFEFVYESDPDYVDKRATRTAPANG